MTDDLVVRHFLLCRKVRYNLEVPYAPYSLDHVVTRIRPPSGYPLVVEDLWAFVLLLGTGHCELWVDVVYRGPTDADSDESTVDELVASYGPYPAPFGDDPRLLARGWHARYVPFTRPGSYDFRLLHRGVILATEPVELEEH